MPVSNSGHRVIGILHALKQLKNAGLVEDDSSYPHQAVQDVQSEILSVAQTWYGVGAKRGGREVLKAFLNGDFEVRIDTNGNREIIANVKSLTWTRGLNVTVGNSKQKISNQQYKLTVKNLGFDV